MKLFSPPISGVLLSLAVAAAPAALASSSSGLAQTPELPTQLQVTPPVLPPSPEAADPAPMPVPAPVVAEAAPAARPAPARHHVECVAKVILHEARDEPRPGRIAVAQVIRARIRDGRFAGDACAVTRQRGQFFNVDAFTPPRNEHWQDAVAIASDTLAGEGSDLVPGALFFHAKHKPMVGRRRVGQIGGHVFYR